MGVIDLVIFEHPDRQSTIGGFIFWETGLRKIFSFLLLSFVPVVCMAHTLHVGEMSIPLHTTKYTTPSVHFLIDGDVWYLPMLPQDLSGGMHMHHNNITYTICSGEKTHLGHYWYIGDCLVDVDDNVYLESTGGASIRTNLSTPNGVRAVFRVKNNTDGMHYVWGSHGTTSPYGRNYFEFYYNGVGDLGAGAYYLLDYTFNVGDVYDIDMATFVDNIYINVNNSAVTFRRGDTETDWRAENNLGLFGISRYSTIPGSPVSLYHIMFLDETGRKLAHFIPVPSGMQIGDYVVPSNGMWDTVEQKFYGNSNTGEFVYGVDE